MQNEKCYYNLYIADFSGKIRGTIPLYRHLGTEKTARKFAEERAERERLPMAIVQDSNRKIIDVMYPSICEGNK